MAKRWSKLKSKVEALFVKKLPLRVHCTAIRKTWENDGSLPEQLGVFTIRLEKEVIWDFPKQFVDYSTGYPDGGNHYSYSVADINNTLREYIDTPKDELLTKQFSGDHFGITDILKCADRRLGTKKIESHFHEATDSSIRLVLAARKRLV